MDVFYLTNNNKIVRKDESLLNIGGYKNHWIVPEELPGETVAEGKKWCIHTLIEMIRAGGEYDSLKEVAEYFCVPLKIFQGLYEKVINEYAINN